MFLNGIEEALYRIIGSEKPIYTLNTTDLIAVMTQMIVDEEITLEQLNPEVMANVIGYAQRELSIEFEEPLRQAIREAISPIQDMDVEREETSADVMAENMERIEGSDFWCYSDNSGFDVI